MRQILSAIFLFSLIVNLSAQVTFSKSIDLTSSASNGFGITVSDDGYTILASSVDIPLLADYISIVHTDFDGEIGWQKHYKNEPWKINIPSLSNGGILTDQEGNLYIIGVIQVSGNPFDVFLMKTTPEGDSIWMRTYGGEFEDYNAKVLFYTDTTILFLNMITLSNDVNDFTIWLMETDLEGNVLWEKTFDGGYAIANPRDLILLDNGDFLISYFVCEFPGLCDTDNPQMLAITRFDKDGEELWTKDIAIDEDVTGIPPIIENLDNGKILISFYRMNFEEGWWYPPILVWVDSSGNIINQYDFPPDTERYIRDLHKTSSGDIIGVGYVDMLELGLGGWVFAMSQEGELLWSRDINDLRFPEKKWGRFNAVQESENGGLIITGFILDTVENNHLASVSNIWLVKLDSAGCLEPDCGDVQIISSSAEIKESNELAIFKIYLNPVNGNNCLLERNPAYGAIGKVNIEILDCLGRHVWKRNASDDPVIQLETSGFQRGFYLVRIEDGEGRILQLEKLIIP